MLWEMYPLYLLRSLLSEEAIADRGGGRLIIEGGHIFIYSLFCIINFF